MAINQGVLGSVKSNKGKFVITNRAKTKFLSGDLATKKYLWVDTPERAFTFKSEAEASDFEDSNDAIREFLEDELTGVQEIAVQAYTKDDGTKVKAHFRKR